MKNKSKYIILGISLLLIISFILINNQENSASYDGNFATNDDMVIFNGEVYLIKDEKLWKYNSESQQELVEIGLNGMPEKIYTDGIDGLYVIDESGNLEFIYPDYPDENEYLNNGSGYSFYTRECLEKYNSENPYICVNGHPDLHRKALLQDGTVIGVLDDITTCEMNLAEEKIVYLSGNFALSDKGNLYKIQLSQEEGMIINQAECIYNAGDIVQIDAFYGCLAIKNNGQVLYFADSNETNNKWGEGNVNEWNNVVTVACDRLYSIGLTSKGEVLFTGENVAEQCEEAIKELSEWKNITKICANSGVVAGLDKAGGIHIVELQP